MDELRVMYLCVKAGKAPEDALLYAQTWRKIDLGRSEYYKSSEWDTAVEKTEKTKEYLNEACDLMAALPREEIETIQRDGAYFPYEAVDRVTELFFNILRKGWVNNG